MALGLCGKIEVARLQQNNAPLLKLGTVPPFLEADYATFDAQRVQVPMFEASGSKRPNLDGIWYQCPQIFGTWTFWERTPAASLEV